MVRARWNRGNGHVAEVWVLEIVGAHEVDSCSCDREIYFQIVALSGVEEQEEKGSCDVDSESCDVDSESCDLDSESCDVDSESCDVDSESCDVDSESCDVNSESCDMDKGGTEDRPLVGHEMYNTCEFLACTHKYRVREQTSNLKWKGRGTE